MVKLRGGARVHRWTTTSLPLVLFMLLMLTLVILILLAFDIISLPVAPDIDSPIKFTRKTFQLGDGVVGRKEGERGEQWTEVLSWEPRAFLYHNFLSKEECEYLIELAKPHMEKSTVVDSATGKSKDSRSVIWCDASYSFDYTIFFLPRKCSNVLKYICMVRVRTSSGMFLRRGRDKIISEIEQRIADFAFIPVEHGEGLQVLHYEVGQKYEPHYDYFLDEFNTKNGGQRIATVLMYLSDVEEGGETVFPEAKGNISDVSWWDELSTCGKKGLSVKPKMGDALLFWSMRPDGTLDPSSLHGGCPVIRGNKWSSTKWMHVSHYKV
uniref:procollagen-proline 4-dioxygenase n=1 Tax=Kalanchoe fedtschenkoi TaxID=63787 RepID=A0A7N0UIB2_KALFE